MPDPSPLRLIAALFAAGLVLAPAAPVFAEPIGGVEEVDTDEADLRRALALVREGDAEAAGALTRAVLARAPDLAAGHEILGVILAGQGDLEGAAEALERAVEIEPARVGAWTKLGDVRLAQGDRAAARGHFVHALGLDPADRHANQRMGLMLREEGDVAGAIAAFERGIAGTPPDYLGVKLDLALLYTLAGRPERAAEMLAPFAEDPGADIAVHRALANAELTLERFDAAEAGYRAALALDPDDAQSLLGLGVALRAGGDMAGALAAQEAALERAPGNPLVMLELARTRHLAGDDAAAIAGLEAALAEGPADPAPFETALAELHAAAGDVDRAAEIWAAQIDAGRAPPAAYANLGVLAQRAGDVAGAEAVWLEMAAAFPDSAEADFRLGALYGALDRWPEAAARYDAALERAPGAPEILRGAANARRMTGEGALAIGYAERLANRVDAAPGDHFLLGVLLQGEGRTDAAADRYRRTIAVEPDHWPSLNNLAVILTEEGDLDEALRLARRASELAPDEAAATDTLGQAMFRAGDPEARAVLARAVEQDPRGAIYRLHLARAEAAAGDVEAARMQAATALELDPEGPDSAEIRDFLEGL